MHISEILLCCYGDPTVGIFGQEVAIRDRHGDMLYYLNCIDVDDWEDEIDIIKRSLSDSFNEIWDDRWNVSIIVTPDPNDTEEQRNKAIKLMDKWKIVLDDIIVEDEGTGNRKITFTK